MGCAGRRRRRHRNSSAGVAGSVAGGDARRYQIPRNRHYQFGRRYRLPPPLPEPLAAPDELQTVPLDAGSVPPPPDDLEEFLYAHRINFAAGGAPLVTVRLMEGQDQIELSGDSELKLILHGFPDSQGKQVGVPAHQPLRIRLRESTPAALREYAQVADLKIDDREGLREAKALWEGRGFQVQVRTIGTVYGVAGRVLDNRRSLVLLGEGGGTEQAQSLLAQVRRDYGDPEQLSVQLYEELSRRPTGVLEVQDQTGATVAASRDLVAIDSPGDILVRRVEYGVGYAFHGFQDRRYRGRLFVAVDRLGKLALVEALPLEELLRGLVPAEMFASAPAEALKAQAITARGEVLAKIGARHLYPIHICSAQSSIARCTGDWGASGLRPTPPFGRRGARRSSVVEAGWWSRSTRRCAAGTPRTTTWSGAARLTRACAASAIWLTERRHRGRRH